MGHGGYYGTVAAYWPARNTTIVATMNQSLPAPNVSRQDALNALLTDICNAVKSASSR
jgi:CubicO group peptidase (beta-lactamase class C family)